MTNLLQQLENNEAVLLMYLADELPPEDREEVEQMLASDAGLRAQCERLRQMDEVIGQTARGQTPRRLRSTEAVSVRKVGRAVEAWHREQAERGAVQLQQRDRRAWFAYPLAAAATVLLALSLWTTFFRGAGTPALDQQWVMTDPTDIAPDRQMEIERARVAEAEHLLYWSLSDTPGFADLGSLREVERQVDVWGEPDDTEVWIWEMIYEDQRWN